MTNRQQFLGRHAQARQALVAEILGGQITVAAMAARDGVTTQAIYRKLVREGLHFDKKTGRPYRKEKISKSAKQPTVVST